MRVLFVAAMLVGTLAPFVSGGRAHACLCQPLTAKAQVEMATVILVGTPTGNFDDRANGVAFEIEVDQTIRGSIGDTILVRGMGSCSVDLYPGQRYILLGEMTEEELSTTVCSGSGSLGTSKAADIVSAIEATGVSVDTSQAQQQEPEAEHKDVPWIPILILALAIPTAALVIPAFFMAKRHDDGKGPPS